MWDTKESCQGNFTMSKLYEVCCFCCFPLPNQIWTPFGDDGQLRRQRLTCLKQTEHHRAQSHYCEGERCSASKTVSCESAPEDWRWAADPHRDSASQPCLQNTLVCSGRWGSSRSRGPFLCFCVCVLKGLEVRGECWSQLALKFHSQGNLFWAGCVERRQRRRNKRLRDGRRSSVFHGYNNKGIVHENIQHLLLNI